MADELYKELYENQVKLTENEAKMARLVGRAEGAFDNLRNDGHLVDTLRVQAWMRARPELVVQQDGLAYKGVPDGWPATVPDPDEYVAEQIAQRRDNYIASTFGAAGTNVPDPAPTPSVTRFRKLAGLGDET